MCPLSGSGGATGSGGAAATDGGDYCSYVACGVNPLVCAFVGCAGGCKSGFCTP
jgi:hypothetical protein